MIKKLSLIFIGILLGLSLIGCSKQDPHNEDDTSAITIQEESLNLNKLDDAVDIDLTALSSTLVYAEVYSMMMSPEEYMGQTIKMKGTYCPLYSEETGKYYHYVIIEDAAACCQQGIEFIWGGEHVFPDDYPSEGTEVEVVGVFDTYEELGDIYPYVATNEIKIIQ